uniref:PE family protein n=1 Tax=Mycobacterium sp. (strain JLS) TaxID=164757 RepID=A0A5Q5CCA0_MYCSJ
MSTMATHFRGGVTRLQVGTAACAVAAAAAFPAVVANAEPAAPAPLAPVTQILIDAPLSPVMSIADLAEQPAWLENGRTIIERFGALVFEVARGFIAPVVAFAQAVITAVQRFFQIGPYDTGRG